MAQYFFPQLHPHTSIAPSLLDRKRGVGTQPPTSGDQALDDWARRSSVGSVNEDFGTIDGLRSGSISGDGVTLPDGRSTNGERKESFVDPAHFRTVASFKHARVGSNPAEPDSPYNTIAEPENPTVVPKSLLKQFHYAFLIRHPRYSIPSYYRCCIPPLDKMTGFHEFRPNEAGYLELRAFFDYCRSAGFIGPDTAGYQKAVKGDMNGVNGHTKKATEICLIDADDLLDDPQGIMQAFCKSVDIEWTEDMLHWESEEDHEFAVEAFEKWKGFHEDAINSNDLSARGTVSQGPLWFSRPNANESI